MKDIIDRIELKWECLSKNNAACESIVNDIHKIKNLKYYAHSNVNLNRFLTLIHILFCYFRVFIITNYQLHIFKAWTILYRSWLHNGHCRRNAGLSHRRAATR